MRGVVHSNLGQACRTWNNWCQGEEAPMALQCWSALIRRPVGGSYFTSSPPWGSKSQVTQKGVLWFSQLFLPLPPLLLPPSMLMSCYFIESWCVLYVQQGCSKSDCIFEHPWLTWCFNKASSINIGFPTSNTIILLPKPWSPCSRWRDDTISLLFEGQDRLFSSFLLVEANQLVSGPDGAVSYWLSVSLHHQVRQMAPH